MVNVDGVTAGYGTKQILTDVTLSVARSERVAIVGPNGAGKSTLLKTIAGLLPPWAGRVVVDGEDVTRMSVVEHVERGVVYFVQGGVVFPSMTVSENLAIGLHRTKGDREERTDAVLDLFPEMKQWLARRAGLLSGGQRQTVALSMVLLKAPQVLLLDEPSAGLSPALVRRSLSRIAEASGRWGMTVLMVEQNIREAFEIAERAFVLVNGAVEHVSEQPRELLSSGRLGDLFIGAASRGSGTQTEVG